MDDDTDYVVQLLQNLPQASDEDREAWHGRRGRPYSLPEASDKDREEWEQSKLQLANIRKKIKEQENAQARIQGYVTAFIDDVKESYKKIVKFLIK